MPDKDITFLLSNRHYLIYTIYIFMRFRTIKPGFNELYLLLPYVLL